MLGFLRDNTDDISFEENARAHEEWCNHLAAKLLCVFVLDRFGDFVSDQVSLLYFFRGSVLEQASGGSACPGDCVTNPRFVASSYAIAFRSARPLRLTTDDTTRFPAPVQA